MSSWKLEEIETASKYLESGKTYKEISLYLNRTEKAVKVKLFNCGLTTRQFKNASPPALCKHCGKEILNSGKKYCSRICFGKDRYSNCLKKSEVVYEGGVKSVVKIPTNKCIHCGEPCIKVFCSVRCQMDNQYDSIILDWKNGINNGHTGLTKRLKTPIRKYILQKYDYKCCRCGWSEKHPITGNYPLEVNHIDGNAENCHEDNLELLCPNCHSLTYNFRALNKDSKRIR